MATSGALLLAVDFNKFCRQYSFRFHAFRTIILQILLTLTSSTSFGEYLNAGTTYPAGLSLAGLHHETLYSWFRTQDQAKKSQKSQVKIERLEPSQVGSTCNDKPMNQDPNQLKEQCATIDQRDSATEGQDEPEPSRPASFMPAGLSPTCSMPKQPSTASRRRSSLAASVILMVAILTGIALPVAALENVPGVVKVA